MLRVPTYRTLVLLAVLISQSSTLTRGQAQDAPQFDSITVAFDGHGKVGKWLPVRAHASGLTAGREFELRMAFADPRGDICVQAVDHATASAAGKVQFSGAFRVGRLVGRGHITIVDSATSADVLQQSIPHGPTVAPPDPDTAVQDSLRLRKLSTRTLMTFGEVPGVEELMRNAIVFSPEDDLLLNGITVHDTEDLPDSITALDSIDSIFLTDAAELSEDCVHSIREWVYSGGRLIVSSAQNVNAFRGTTMGTWIDGLFDLGERPITIRDLASVQSYVSGSRRLETNRIACPLAVIGSDQAVTEIDSLNGPIMSSVSVGGGCVTLIAVDVHRKPVSQWASLPQFYEVLLFGERLSQQSGEGSRTSRISQSGVSDMATQMQATVDVVPPSGGWSTWAIMAVVAGFLLLIGPVDYVLVTHILKRPHFTWITFPLMIAAGVIAMTTAGSSDVTHTANQLHVVDVYADGQQSDVVTRSWMSLSSSVTERVDVVASPMPGIPSESEEPEVVLTWNGRPEDVYGGMYREGGIDLGRQMYQYRLSQPDRLLSLPLLTNGSRALAAEWRQSFGSELISSRLAVSGFGLLTGSFQHHLPVPVTDWIILFGNRVYRVEALSKAVELAADQTCRAGGDMYASDIKTFLNGSRLVAADVRDGQQRATRVGTQVVTPYNVKSTDDRYILAMTSFYEAAGGSSYVGLSQTQLRDLEVSDTIRLNHAILLGRADWSTTSLQVGETVVEPTVSKTIVRLFLPVDRKPSGDRARTDEEIEDEQEGKEN